MLLHTALCLYTSEQYNYQIFLTALPHRNRRLAAAVQPALHACQLQQLLLLLQQLCLLLQPLQQLQEEQQKLRQLLLSLFEAATRPEQNEEESDDFP